MEHIEVMFEQATQNDWELKLDKDDIKVWLKKQPKAGTDHPLIVETNNKRLVLAALYNQKTVIFNQGLHLRRCRYQTSACFQNPP
jgi:hypothetical protein